MTFCSNQGEYNRILPNFVPIRVNTAKYYRILFPSWGILPNFVTIRVNTTEQLLELRELMIVNNLAAYIVPIGKLCSISYSNFIKLIRILLR